jgi:hypothetical protein
VVRGWLAATTAIGIAISVPIAGATTFVVGGTNTVGPPSQASMQGLVKQKFIPQDQLVGVDYPAQLWPVSGTVTLDDSVAHGTDALDDDVQDVHRDDPDEPITIVGISQGAVVMNYEKRRLMAEPAADRPTDLTFVTIADPTNADGGLMTKFAPLYIPVLNFTFTGPPVDTPYHTVEYVREYDGIGDFPDHLLNVAADANALLGAAYLHADYGGVDPTDPANVVTTTKPNSQGGTTTHVVIPTKYLPLTQPLRDLGVNPTVVDAIDKPLRKVIDAGYDGPRPGNPHGTRPLARLRAAVDKARGRHPNATAGSLSGKLGKRAIKAHHTAVASD